MLLNPYFEIRKSNLILTLDTLGLILDKIIGKKL
jgi:hypothetical protein